MHFAPGSQRWKHGSDNRLDGPGCVRTPGLTWLASGRRKSWTDRQPLSIGLDDACHAVSQVLVFVDDRVEVKDDAKVRPFALSQRPPAVQCGLPISL